MYKSKNKPIIGDRNNSFVEKITDSSFLVLYTDMKHDIGTKIKK